MSVSVGVDTAVGELRYWPKVPVGMYPANGGCYICGKSNHLVSFPTGISPEDTHDIREGQLCLCATCLRRALDVLPEASESKSRLQEEIETLHAELARVSERVEKAEHLAVELSTYVETYLKSSTVYPCEEPGCTRVFTTEAGRAIHVGRAHPSEVLAE